MQIINRKGGYNDVMFKELGEFAQHQIKTSPYRHEVKLLMDGKEVATLEDVRIVYNVPKEVQVKARVAESKHLTFAKATTAKMTITAIAPNPEPPSEVVITEWFEEVADYVPGVNEADIVITPNKWLYFKGTK